MAPPCRQIVPLQLLTIVHVVHVVHVVDVTLGRNLLQLREFWAVSTSMAMAMAACTAVSARTHPSGVPLAGGHNQHPLGPVGPGRGLQRPAGADA